MHHLEGCYFQLVRESGDVIGDIGSDMSYGEFSGYLSFTPERIEIETRGDPAAFRFDLTNEAGKAYTF